MDRANLSNFIFVKQFFLWISENLTMLNCVTTIQYQCDICQQGSKESTKQTRKSVAGQIP